MAIVVKSIHALVDLTLLNEQAESKALEELASSAQKQGVAAVCVYPHHLRLIPPTIKRATVLNFPSGQHPHQNVLKELSQILEENLADEIDYVFPYKDYLSGHADQALRMCHEIYQICLTHRRKLKVILETGALPSAEMIHQLSLELIQRGCHFLKTSTGKITTGATIEAASAILSAIKTSDKSCGIKISGGIRTREQALDYIRLAENILQKPIHADWFRIGTSGLKS